MRSNRYTVEQWGWGLVVAALVIGLVPILAGWTGGGHGYDHGMGHDDGSAAHVPHVADPEAFCTAIGALLDADLGSGVARAVATGGVDGLGAAAIEQGVLPALGRLHELAPHELHPVLDHANRAYESAIRLGRGDESARATLATNLAADPTSAAPLAAAVRAACAADEVALDVTQQAFLLGPSTCTNLPQRAGFAGEERLPTLADLNAVPGFGAVCPVAPVDTPDSATVAAAPCGGALQPVELADAIGARYGSGLDSVTEVIGRPGGGAASVFVAQLNADVRTGCRPSGDSPFTDVQPAVVPGLSRAYAAFRGTASVALPFPGMSHRYAATQTLVAVAVGEELMVLVVSSPSPPDDDNLGALVATAVRRAGW